MHPAERNTWGHENRKARATFACSYAPDTSPRRDPNGKTWDLFKVSADGSAGYVPMSLPGSSALDISNAFAMVHVAGPKLGNPIDPTTLTGKGADAYSILLRLGVAPEDIKIYQDDGRDFAADLSRRGFDALMHSGQVRFILAMRSCTILTQTVRETSRKNVRFTGSGWTPTSPTMSAVPGSTCSSTRMRIIRGKAAYKAGGIT